MEICSNIADLCRNPTFAMTRFTRLFRQSPIIGVIHLAPLPGAPGFGGEMGAVLDRAAGEAAAYQAAGLDGVIVENYGDAPFFPGRVPAETVAAMAAAAHRVRQAAPGLPLGINVLRNDARSALAVAAAVGAGFIRVNVLAGAMVTDQGLIEGEAHALLRLRAALKADDVAILADIRVKHAAPLAPRPLAEEARDLAGRGGADALIVTGTGTGEAADPAEIDAVKAASGLPVLVGSGATAQSAKGLLARADGLIVGSAFKREGKAEQPVDPDRLAAFVKAAR